MRRTALAESGEATRATALPLGVIAITFFMRDERAAFLMIAPVFLSAAVLCVALVYTFATKRSATLVSLVSMFWSVLASAFVAIALAGDHDMRWIVFAIAAVSAPLFGLAWSSRGLRRLTLLVDAYLFSTFPFVFLVLMGAAHYGAYVFIAAYVMLVLMRALDRLHALRGASSGRCSDRVSPRRLSRS